MTTPPSNLPRYRLLTGPDDEAFCRRVSEAPVMGFELYGSPAATNNGKEVTVEGSGQVKAWPRADINREDPHEYCR